MKKYLRMTIYFILFTLIIGAFIYLGEKDFKEEKNLTDSQRFALEYGIDENNMFVYSYGSEVVDVIKNKTGIIYLGFSSNEWSKKYIEYLYPVLNENNIKLVYYYDIQKDRSVSSKYYRELQRILDPYLFRLDSGETRIFTPALILVKDGNIIHFEDDTAINRTGLKPSEYWDSARISDFNYRIDTYLNEVNYNE